MDMKGDIRAEKHTKGDLLAFFRESHSILDYSKPTPPVFNSFLQGLLFAIVLFISQTVYAEQTAKKTAEQANVIEQCEQELAKEVLDIQLIKKVCLQAAKQEEANKQYGRASWYYLLAGELDYLIKEMPQYIDPKTSTVIYAKLGHAYVLKDQPNKAKEMYWKFITLGGPIIRDKKYTSEDYKTWQNMLLKDKKDMNSSTKLKAIKLILRLMVTDIPIQEDYKLLNKRYLSSNKVLMNGVQYWTKTKEKFLAQIKQANNPQKIIVPQKAVKQLKQTISLETSGESFEYKGTAGLQDIDNKLSGSGNTYGVKSPENLKVTHNLACEGKEKIKNIYTPADLFPVVIKCMKEKQYDKARDYYIIAHIFGYFDQLRVLDKSARVATNALKTEALLALKSMDLPKEEILNLTFSKLVFFERSQLKKEIEGSIESFNQQRIQLLKGKNTAEGKQDIELTDKIIASLRILLTKKGMEKVINYKTSLCISLKKIGMPTYYPEYMIQHGLVALAKKEIKGKGIGDIKEGENMLDYYNVMASNYEIEDFRGQVMDMNGNGIIPNVNLDKNWKNTFSEFSICK